MSEPDDDKMNQEDENRHVFKEKSSKILSFSIGLFGFIIINIMLFSLIGLFVIFIDVALIIIFYNYDRYVMFGIILIPI